MLTEQDYTLCGACKASQFTPKATIIIVGIECEGERVLGGKVTDHARHVVRAFNGESYLAFADASSRRTLSERPYSGDLEVAIAGFTNRAAEPRGLPDSPFSAISIPFVR